MKNLKKSSGTFPKGKSKVLPVAAKAKTKKVKSQFALSNRQKMLDHADAVKNIKLTL